MVLLAGDLAAIEPRALAYLAKDKASLDAARNTKDWYEARARAWGLYDKPEPLKVGDSALRDRIKQLEIGLGYGMGPDTYQKKTGLTAEKAFENHQNYRLWNPKVEDFWKLLRKGLYGSIGADFSVTLPSGRKVKFRSIRKDEKSNNMSFLRLTPRGYVRKNVFAGFATENLVQALARDIYMDRVLAVSRAGLRIVLRVHDEIVCEVPEDKAEESAKLLKQIMETPPSWAPDLPLAAGVNWGRTYADAK